jgi:hypothetical protein
MRWTLLATVLLFATPAARAEDAPAEAQPNPEAEAAKKLVKQYLDLLAKAGEGKKPRSADVAKKLEAAKKLIHPKTLELIAEQQKRKTVTIGLAAWYFAKDEYYLKSYELQDVKVGALGTFVIEASERNWRVQEGGEDAEPEPASYLVGPFKGKWFIADKKRNETFNDKGIKAGYKGYFDEPEKKEAAAPEEKKE